MGAPVRPVPEGAGRVGAPVGRKRSDELTSMSTSTRTILGSVVLAGPTLVLWGAPILPVAVGCVLAAGLLLLRERRRGSRSLPR
jgi:hypothetical protein